MINFNEQQMLENESYIYNQEKKRKKLKKLQMNCAKKDLKMYCLLPREARWL